MFGYFRDYFQNFFLFKKPDYFRHLLYCHSKLAMIFFDMKDYCDEKGLPFCLTSFIRSIERDKQLGASSKTHQQGRAFDLSVKGWDVYAITDFINHFNLKYKHLAAISVEDLMPRLVVYHEGTTSWHLHIQIHSRYSIENAWANL